MTDNREVMLQNYTRREFRQGLEAGKFQAAIIPTGSIEQHLEHLPFDRDIASSTWVARQSRSLISLGSIRKSVGRDERDQPLGGQHRGLRGGCHPRGRAAVARGYHRMR